MSALTSQRAVNVGGAKFCNAQEITKFKPSGVRVSHGVTSDLRQVTHTHGSGQSFCFTANNMTSI